MDDVPRCYICEQELPAEEFPRDASKPSGRMSRCRPCDNTKRKADYWRNVDRERARKRVTVT